jgi:hypothetical protein
MPRTIKFTAKDRSPEAPNLTTPSTREVVTAFNIILTF